MGDTIKLSVHAYQDMASEINTLQKQANDDRMVVQEMRAALNNSLNANKELLAEILSLQQQLQRAQSPRTFKTIGAV